MKRIVLLLMLISCTNEQTPIDNGSVDVFFCPRQNCSLRIQEVLRKGTQINCAFFDLEDDKIIGLLREKEANVVIDGDNFINISPNARKETKSSYMHNKFCIVDNKTIITGSYNPTQNTNNNNLVIINSGILAKNYHDEFLELWNGTYGKGKTVKNPIVNLSGKIIKNYFCPEDNCRMRVKDEIENANKSIYFLVFSFTDGGIATDLILKHREGIEVRGVFEKMHASRGVYQLLRHQGIDVALDTNPKFLHHKVFIIDNKTVITGSFNPSKNANEKNDENIMIISDAATAGRYVEEFNTIRDNSI